MTQGQIVLRRREEKRILAGHAWVFSNEIERIEGNPAPGSVVAVTRAEGKLVGYGLFNPKSLIAVRIFSRRHRALDHPLLVERIRKARALRERLYPGADGYRLVHGESDGLPGLIVDRYAGAISLQTLALGMDLVKEAICDALEEILRPHAIVERNESALRDYEGLPRTAGLLRGALPGPLTIHEGDVAFEVDLLEGHKTGFFYDQRENRQAVRRVAKGSRVLDLYCHDGAFALQAARAGAREVLGVDISGEAVARAVRNAAINDLAGISRFEAADASEAMKALHDAGERFDVVVIDPPSFTRSKKNVAEAKRGYVDVNRRAIRLLTREGFLATACCSHHVTDETFLECVQEAAQGVDRSLRLIEWRSQAPDHPILPAMPETRYLKFALLQVD
ncbi:MAG TPA: class I SAM-dependent rRNA methyltransferase [Verrucomicrobiae bacterium]|nr:class I SAM-dependent rRNA methyltransferase [Verrucomicrobiae bacterium]